MFEGMVLKSRTAVVLAGDDLRRKTETSLTDLATIGIRQLEIFGQAEAIANLMLGILNEASSVSSESRLNALRSEFTTAGTMLQTQAAELPADDDITNFLQVAKQLLEFGAEGGGIFDARQSLLAWGAMANSSWFAASPCRRNCGTRSVPWWNRHDRTVTPPAMPPHPPSRVLAC